jgi:hypothetical protein
MFACIHNFSTGCKLASRLGCLTPGEWLCNTTGLDAFSKAEMSVHAVDLSATFQGSKPVLQYSELTNCVEFTAVLGEG